MTKRLITAVLAALMIFGVAAAAATPASAAAATAPTRVPPIPPLPGFPTPDCSTAPVPVSPDRGFMGYFSARPETPPALDVDVFAEGSTTTVYDAYGMAGGYPWHVYSTSCIPGPGQAAAGIWTDVANVMRGFVALNVGVIAMLSNLAYDPDWLGFLEAPTQYISSSLYNGVVTPLAWIIVLGTGILLLARWRQAKISAVVGLGAMVCAVFLIGSTAANYPTRISDTTDAITTGSLTVVTNTIAGSTSNDPASGLVSPVVQTIMYERWVDGTLGDTDSATALQYGPILFDAQALTWAESAVVQSDPNGAGKTLIEAKQKQWADASAAIEESDPEAYAYLTGQTRAYDRVNSAVVSLFMLLALPFLMVSLCLVVMSFVIVRLLIMFLPLVALITLMVGGSLRSLANIGLASIINSVIFGIGAALNTFIIATLLAPNIPIPAPVALLLTILVGLALWKLLDPYRKLTALVGFNNPVDNGMRAMTQAESEMRNFTVGAAKTAAGVVGAKILAAKVLPGLTGQKKNGADAATQADVPEREPNYSRPEGVILDDPIRTGHKHYTYAEGGSGEVDLYGAQDRTPVVVPAPTPRPGSAQDIVDGEVVETHALPSSVRALSSPAREATNLPAAIPSQPYRINLEDEEDEDVVIHDRPEGRVLYAQDPVASDTGDDVFYITTLNGIQADNEVPADSRQEADQ